MFIYTNGWKTMFFISFPCNAFVEFGLFNSYNKKRVKIQK